MHRAKRAGAALAPLLGRLYSRHRKPTDLADVSARTWQLSPSTRRRARAAVFDPAELSRVSAAQEHTSLAHERVRIDGGWREHGATRAYLVRDALLLDGHLFAARLALPLKSGSMPWLGREPERQLGQGVLAASQFGIRYFGHWLHDDLPRALIGAELGSLIAPRYPHHSHQDGLAQLCGADTRTVDDCRIDRLILLDDEGRNNSMRFRMNLIRAAVRRGRSGSTAPRGVLFMRRATGMARGLLNEDEVAGALAREGFRLVCPGECDLSTLLDLTLDAQIAVGVEGSQLANALVTTAAGGTVLTLQPPDRFNNNFADLCDCSELGYGFTVGVACEGGFRVDIDALRRLIDRVS